MCTPYAWVGKIYSLSPKMTRYVCDFFLCENMNVNICLEVDLLCVGSLSHDSEFLTQANVYVLAKHCSPQIMTVSQNNITS